MEWNWLEAYGRDRDRTDDLYRVKVALIPTELRALKVSTPDCMHAYKSLSIECLGGIETLPQVERSRAISPEIESSRCKISWLMSTRLFAKTTVRLISFF